MTRVFLLEPGVPFFLQAPRAAPCCGAQACPGPFTLPRPPCLRRNQSHCWLGPVDTHTRLTPGPLFLHGLQGACPVCVHQGMVTVLSSDDVSRPYQHECDPPVSRPWVPLQPQGGGSRGAEGVSESYLPTGAAWATGSGSGSAAPAPPGTL